MSRKLVEQSIMHLLNRNSSKIGSGKRFYGYFLMNMRKHYDTNKAVETLAVNITNQVNLYINTEFFKSLTEQQRIEVLEHECKHVISYHQQRTKDLDDCDHKLWNIACDAAINEPLTSLHEMGVTVKKLRSLVPSLERNQTAEYYYKALKEYREENGGKDGKGQSNIESLGDTVDDHDAWGKDDKLKESTDNTTDGVGNIEEINKQIIKRAMKDAVDKCDGRGNVPIEILNALDALNKSTINWKQQLKQFFARADRFSKEATRKKLNRRYRHLNPGRRKSPQTHIAIGVDESGSVCDELHKQFFSEIDAAARLDGIRFTIINADCTVNKVYDYVAGMKIERTGMGGTAYMPAINEASKLKVDGMIYFGDGDIWGEQLTKTKFPFLWAMEDGRNAPADWGKVCHVKYDRGNNGY
jgi:predicted metal-dependent peptidase